MIDKNSLIAYCIGFFFIFGAILVLITDYSNYFLIIGFSVWGCIFFLCAWGNAKSKGKRKIQQTGYMSNRPYTPPVPVAPTVYPQYQAGFQTQVSNPMYSL